MKFKSKLKLKSKNEAFVAHFRFLGLDRGECRTNVIRSAAQAMSTALTYAGDHIRPSMEDVRRAQIAYATYRLLDPRERADIYERVQLCYPVDREDVESSTVASSELLDKMPAIPVPATPIQVSEPIASELSLDERRGVVQIIRELDESTLRGLSPLGWLRLRLGI